MTSLIDLEPVPTLLARLRAEASGGAGGGAGWDWSKPVRVSRAPGRLDVMGGITDYTGGTVCEMPLSVGTAVAVQDRNDLQVNVLSLNLLDEHVPFAFQMPLASLAMPVEQLRRELAEPGRAWAAYVVGCLAVMHAAGLLDVTHPEQKGLNIAVWSTVPIGAGVSSSAALEVATMNALVDHYDVKSLRDNGLQLAEFCQRVENEVVGAPCGIMDQVTCHLGEAGRMLRLKCQPHELLPLLDFPQGVTAVGIDTGVRHNITGEAYARTRTAALMGFRLIFREMSRLATDSGRQMVGDPTGGYLANLPASDYKSLFRNSLPESMKEENTGIAYPVQAACDHHVLEAQRVRRFCDFIENIDKYGRHKALASCGHLMYASHRSYGERAGLGCEEADVLVELVKRYEAAGLHGARISGGGGGGTVAVLLDDSSTAAEAVAGIVLKYREKTGRTARMLTGSSPGAAQFGSQIVVPAT